VNLDLAMTEITSIKNESEQDLQEFIIMCRETAPEFILIEEVIPSQAIMTVYHNDSK